MCIWSICGKNKELEQLKSKIWANHQKSHENIWKLISHIYFLLDMVQIISTSELWSLVMSVNASKSMMIAFLYVIK
jgi:hypothetical protein